MSTDGRVLRPATRSSPELSARLRRPSQHGARPWQIVVATVTATLIVGLLITMTIARSTIAELVASPLADKLADTDRVAYYVIPEDVEDSPSFRIGPGDVSIKLITHVELPNGHEFRAADDFAYGIRVRLESLDGELQWEHELNIRTRQSKSGLDRHGWRHENAFLLDDPGSGRQVRQLTDDRLTRVRLPEGVADRRLRISFVPREPSSDVRGLARVYVRHERAVDDRTLRELSLAPEAAAELVDHLTYRDWDQLSDDERRQKLGHVWERMSAEGHAGVDYEILSIYETGYRLPRGTKTDQRRLEVEATRSLAINVIGPAELALEVFGDEELFAGLGVKLRGLDGRDVAYGSSRVAQRSLSVPEGVYTLIIESEAYLELTLEVAEARAADARVWLCEADRPMRTDEEGNEVLEPDVRRIQTVQLGASWDVLPRWAIDGPEDPITQMFRFDVRVVHPLPSSWWGESAHVNGPAPELDLCFFDGEGVELGCEPWKGRPAHESHFEGVRVADKSSLSVPLDTRWHEVSEPQAWRVIAPADATELELRVRAVVPKAMQAAADLDQQWLIVRAYGYWPEVETVVGLPFREYDSEQTIWRYPPLDTRTWFPLRPINYDDLQDDLAISDLLAQVRLQPRGLFDDDGGGADPGDPAANEHAGEDGWDPGPWVTLDPRGVHRRRSILEQLDALTGRRLANRWDASLFTELWPDRNMIVGLSATGPGAPELHWQVDPHTLGRSVRIDIDGQAYEHEVGETRGRWRLPVERGRRDLEFEFDAHNGEYEMWINRPVLVASPPVSRRRVVHELTNSLVFPLRKPSDASLTVNLVVYLPRRRERAELAVTLDDGRPRRRTGIPIERLSLADRSYSIDAGGAFDEQDRLVDPREPIRFVDLEGSNKLPLDVVTIQITLGEDIVPGVHEVRVDLLDGDRVWVRAFHRGVADRSKPAASWTEGTKGSGEVQP